MDFSVGERGVVNRIGASVQPPVFEAFPDLAMNCEMRKRQSTIGRSSWIERPAYAALFLGFGLTMTDVSLILLLHY